MHFKKRRYDWKHIIFQSRVQFICWEKQQQKTQCPKSWKLLHKNLRKYLIFTWNFKRKKLPYSSLHTYMATTKIKWVSEVFESKAIRRWSISLKKCMELFLAAMIFVIMAKDNQSICFSLLFNIFWYLDSFLMTLSNYDYTLFSS